MPAKSRAARRGARGKIGRSTAAGGAAKSGGHENAAVVAAGRPPAGVGRGGASLRPLILIWVESIHLQGCRPAQFTYN
jgi:hypothetical protein